jgi:hypothetical protein
MYNGDKSFLKAFSVNILELCYSDSNYLIISIGAYIHQKLWMHENKATVKLRAVDRFTIQFLTLLAT